MRPPIGIRAATLRVSVCLLAFAGAAHAQTDLSRAQLVRLKNGARLLLAPDSTATAVEVATWFALEPRGAKADPRGLASVLEHLMARRTGADAPGARVAEEGGTAGSFTSRDATCFFETLPAGALEVGIRIEAERMKALVVTPAALVAAREQARADRRARGEDGPARRGLQRLSVALEGGPPSAAPSGDTDADLSRITAKDCQDGFRDLFAPDRVLVTIVGRFDPGRALELAQKWLEPLPRRGTAAPAAGVRTLPIRARRVSEPVDFRLRLLFAGWRAPSGRDADALGLDLLARILYSGPGSRLPRELTGPDRDVLLVQAGYEGRRDGGLFYADLVLRPAADSAAVEKDLLQRIDRLAVEPVDVEELGRARRQAEGTFLFGWETVHGRTAALGSAELVEGDFRAAWNRLERLRQLTPVDLQRAAARTFKSENRALVWLVPAGGASGAAGAPGTR